MNTNRFLQVKDSSNRRLRGLWQRNGSFYVQTTIRDARTGVKKVTKLRLEGAKTAGEAKDAAAVLRSNVEATGSIHGDKCPTLGDYLETYRNLSKKSPKTMFNELHFLNQWIEYLGANTRLDDITATNILAYRHSAEIRLPKPLSPRTINLHCLALKSLLALAKTQGFLSKIPFEGIKQLKEPKTEKQLPSTEEITSLATQCLYHGVYGEQFADFITLGMYCGARLNEMLSLKWSNVWFDKGLLEIVGTKGNEVRHVNLNRQLRNHLLCMKKKSSSAYLFPSFKSDSATLSFKNLLNQIRNETGIHHFTIHSLRHYFASMCVMNGTDYLTIARWLGHKDGGILIGKVYGHLNDQHLAEQADALTF